MPIDPVCGMTVDEQAPASKALRLNLGCREGDQGFPQRIDTQVEPLKRECPDQDQIGGRSAQHNGRGHFVLDEYLC